MLSATVGDIFTIWTNLCLIASVIAILSGMGYLESVDPSVLRQHPSACFSSVMPFPFFLSLAGRFDQNLWYRPSRYNTNCQAGSRRRRPNFGNPIGGIRAGCSCICLVILRFACSSRFQSGYMIRSSGSKEEKGSLPRKTSQRRNRTNSMQRGSFTNYRKGVMVVVIVFAVEELMIARGMTCIGD